MIDDVRRAREGDLTAFGRLIQENQGWALRQAAGALRDADLAQDAVQEAFLAAFRGLRGLRDDEAFAGWLRVLVRRAAARVLAGRPRPSPEDGGRDEPATEPGPEQAAESAELRERVLLAIAALPEGQREATRLYYFGGYSTTEVADRLGVPVGAVKKRLFDARRRLRRGLPPTTAGARRPGCRFRLRRRAMVASHDF